MNALTKPKIFRTIEEQLRLTKSEFKIIRRKKFTL